MERLTDKCWRNLDPWECCGQDKYCQRGCHDKGGCTNGCIVPKLYSRLAEYEDAEEQGLLLRLPCKLGDTLWTNRTMRGWYFKSKDAPYPVRVVFIGLNDSEEMGYGLFNVEFEKAGCMLDFNFSDIGKTVFLTKEAAIEAMK